MKVEIVEKKGGPHRSAQDTLKIALTQPSVITLKLAPEKVARYERRAEDLVLVLHDGQEITIPNFFVKTPENTKEIVNADGSQSVVATDEARNELVLIDDQGVAWWGQYPEEWSEFHFTEIEADEPAAAWWPLLLGVLGGAGIAAALASTGGAKNKPPVATDDTATGPEDTPVVGNVLANDTDPNGDALSVTSFTINGTNYNAGQTATIPGVGTITISSTGNYTFTPAPNWNGTVPTITYTLSDSSGKTDTADLVIKITPVVDLVAGDDTVTTAEDTPVNGTVIVNDSTTSGGTLTYTKASDPTHGTVVVNPDGTYTYDPSPNYNGTDSFTYTVTDPASGESKTQTVTIIVEPVIDLVAEDDAETTDEDTPITSTVAPNDTTTSGGTLVFSKDTNPANGTVIMSPDGTYTYTPNPNYNGTDSFTYTVNDPASGETKTQTVVITVTPVNDAPVITGGADTGLVVEAGHLDDGTIVAGTPSALGTLTASDLEGDTLDWSVLSPADTTYGTFSVAPSSGQWTYTLNNGLAATQALNEGDSFDLTFTVDASDGNGGTATRDVTITINGTNDMPVITSTVTDATGAVTERGTANPAEPETATGTLTAADVDTGDTKTWSLLTTNGTYGTISIDPTTGQWTYTLDNTLPATQALNAGDTPTESFTARVTDSFGAYADQVIAVTINGSNDAPVITGGADTGLVVEAGHLDDGTIVAGTPSALGTLTASDLEGDTLDWSVLSPADTTYGTFSVDPSSGQWTYTLNNGLAATQALNEGDSFDLTFTVDASDGNGGTATRDVTITINGTNDVPVITSTVTDATGAVTERGTTNPAEPETATGTLTATDVDTGDTKTWSLLTTNGTYGTISIDPTTGQWTYTLDNTLPATQALNAGDTPTESFTARVTDSFGAYADQVIAVTINGSNDAPVITGGADTGLVVEAGHLDDGTIVAGTPSALGTLTASDLEGDTLDWSVLSPADTTYGTFSVDPSSGQWTYTLNNGLAATQALNEGDSFDLTFTVDASDGNGGTATRDVTITINGTNDVPVITSTVTDATGAVTERGTTNPAEPETATGTLTATDVDTGDTKTWSLLTTNGTYGTISIDPTTGQWTYTLDNTLPATQALNAGDTPTESFTARVTDSFGAYADQVIAVTINGSNDAPVITGGADTGLVVEAGHLDDGTIVAGTPSALGTLTASDLEGDTLDWSVLSPADTTYGTFSVDPSSGQWTYTLNNGLAATQALNEGDSFDLTFTVDASDGNGGTATRDVTITINGTNDVPVITSTVTDAIGAVTERGTANPAEPETTTGTLTATDLDTGDTKTWSLLGTTGIYGTISIDPTTGQWTYELNNTLPATQALNAGDTPTETFTARVTDSFGAYADQVITVTINGSNDAPVGNVNVGLALTEDLTPNRTGTLQQFVTDVDDTLEVTGFKVDTNGDGTLEDFNAGQTATLRDGASNTIGTITINSDGTYVFAPVANYAGTVPPITYTMVEDGPGAIPITQTLTLTIARISDAPTVEADTALVTNEDTARALGLKAPIIVDTGTSGAYEDYPERIGEISLTLSGDGAAGVVLTTGGITLTPDANKITIVLTDVPTITALPVAGPGVYYLTTAQYEALQAMPLAESGKDFTITVSVSSYEVDSGGVIRPGIAGAESTQIIDVDVLAITDGANLAISVPSVTFDEDTAYNITGLLTATLTSTDVNAGNDLDGSETYWYKVSDLPIGSVVTIAGVPTTISASITEAVSTKSASATPPVITIQPPLNFSGDIDNVKITLLSQDTDGDTAVHVPAIIESSVTLNLYVLPIASDVVAGSVSGPEDTNIAFLANVSVTDTANGTEVIETLQFDIPVGWIFTPPAPSAGWNHTIAGSTVTINFTDTSMAQSAREVILDGFQILPPTNSSLDIAPPAPLPLTITISDSVDVNGTNVTDQQTIVRDLTITVTPVAETVGAGVTMTGSHTYTSPGIEDQWYALGTDLTDAANTVGHNLMTGWSNVDGDEFIYAVLSPTLTSSTPADSVVGTEFRYKDSGGTWVTKVYTTEPVWIPQPFLASLQVKLPADVAGKLEIKLETGTVDYDDNSEPATQPSEPPKVSGPGVSVAVSGSETLTINTIAPDPDDVTMVLGLNGRAFGLEDTELPLSIKTTSSDASETFNVKISSIPVGSKIFYNGAELTVSLAGEVEIIGFNNSAPLSILPPLNSNDDFTLNVSAVSVDGGIVLATPKTGSINVSVAGIADNATVNLAPAYVTTEAVVDGADQKVSLANLVTGVSSLDVDGSETYSLRISGLPDGMTLVGAATVKTGVGGDRIWAIASDKIADVSIVLEPNYSGTVTFQVAGVSTEDDGDSNTQLIPVDVSFQVTPSPEAKITSELTVVEDVTKLVGLALIQQNGEANETLGDVLIPVSYNTALFTLTLNGIALPSAGLTSEVEGGVTYYRIPEGQVAGLGATGPVNKDGTLGTLDFLYEVIDPSNDGTLAAVTEKLTGSLVITADPATDPIQASINAITIGTVAGVVSNENTVAPDRAIPDTIAVTQGGDFTVTLNVNTPDTDNSEHLVRILIEGVPEGVSVIGASQIGASSWLLIYDDAAALQLTGGLVTVPVQFEVGKGISDSTSTIKMTAMVQDRGNVATSPAAIVTDTVEWTLDIALVGIDPVLLPEIDTWEYNETKVTEDTEFTLASLMDAAITLNEPNVGHNLTIAITDLPEDAKVSGMTFTTVNGVPTWVASTSVAANSDGAAELADLLASIKITSPLHLNDNNGDFGFDAKLIVAAVGGPSVEADAAAAVPVIPVTDEPTITITTNDVNEGAAAVTAEIKATTTIDCTFGTIVGDKIYVQLATGINAGGTLQDGLGNTLTLEPVAGVNGVPNGSYYVVDLNAGVANLTYTAPAGTTLAAGDISFTAWAQSQETNAANTEAKSETGTATAILINNGVTVVSPPIVGVEPKTSTKSEAIKLNSLSLALNDTSGTEAIESILLSGLPVGFILYVGNTADDAAVAGQASNAGSDGTTNSWVVSSGGGLPPYIAILPPPHWSGQLTGLSLVVASGETTITEKLVQTIPLDTITVNPVADGVTLASSIAFGREGRIIDLNLNASMADPVAAVATPADNSTETTTLEIVGLGEHAAFYAGTTALTGFDYNLAADKYTIRGLTQAQLDDLGFVQAAKAITDQDGATAGTQIAITAWTVESLTGEQSPTVSTTITTSVSRVLPTNGDDSFIWNGEAINGRTGTDTVALRSGEDLDHVNLANLLRSVEVIDLSAPGANGITGGLSMADVQLITGSSTGTLTINGGAPDSVVLSSSTEWTQGATVGTHITYTSTLGVTLLIDDDIVNAGHVSYAA